MALFCRPCAPCVHEAECAEADAYLARIFPDYAPHGNRACLFFDDGTDGFVSKVRKKRVRLYLTLHAWWFRRTRVMKSRKRVKQVYENLFG